MAEITQILQNSGVPQRDALDYTPVGTPQASQLAPVRCMTLCNLKNLDFAKNVVTCH